MGDSSSSAGSMHAERLGTPQRGIANPLHPTVLGSLIGAGGSTAFVLVNRGGLPGAWSWLALAAWVLALGFFVWSVLLRRRMLIDPGPPHHAAGLVYVGGILGMLAIIAVGRLILERVDRPELQPAVVVLAVGLHFIPFAWAFRASIFRRIGWSVSVLGVLGLVLGVAAGAVWVDAAAVLTGLVMLVLMALNAVQDATVTGRGGSRSEAEIS